MATKFEELVNEMVNVSFGVAATAVEKTQEVFDGLNAKGEQVRHDTQTPDFARSMSDIFEHAGGVFSDVTARMSTKGETAAERVLDELILARVRFMTVSERVAFMAHVRDLVDSVDDDTVTVDIEVEVEPAPESEAAAASGDTENAQ